MFCLHGLGLSHLVADLLMSVPFIVTALAYIRLKKDKE
jgi:hypothetical protein